ncbi:MAG: DNA alkylation repair protein [Anaerolineaceae bacterium]
MADRAAFDEFVPRLVGHFEAHRDQARAAHMSAYMRGQFPFMGIAGPQQAALTTSALAGLMKPAQAELTGACATLWALPEREFQYAAVKLLRRNVRVCDSSFLPHVRKLVVAKSWWDTVDELASRVVGPLVAAFPELSLEMDVWAGSDNLWVARSAILHQLGFKDRTDSQRLFGYCLLRCGEADFFIRKAIGWALREYSKTDADAVRTFVVENAGRLSGLSKREALLWINGGRKSARPRS